MFQKTYSFLYDVMCFAMEDYADRMAIKSAKSDYQSLDSTIIENQTNTNPATLQLE